MASYDDLRNDSTVSKWLKRINRRAATQKSYLMALDKYIKFTGMSPEELLDEAKREDRDGVDMDERAVMNRRYDFREHLQTMESEKTGRPLSPLSIKSSMLGVKRFYEAFHVVAGELQGNVTAESCPENVKPILRDEIYEVLKICNPVEKAIILVGCASGLAESDIINLKIEQFKKGYDPKTGVTTFENLIRIKTKVRFTTFLTPEASQAVWDYLQYREHPPLQNSEKRLGEIARQKINNDKGYLFIKQKISPKYKLNCLPKEWAANEELRKYKSDSIIHMYDRLAKKTGKENPDGWNIVRSHNMRRFFSLTLHNCKADISPYQIEHMLGHKKNALNRAYVDYTTETLRATYEKAIPYLTIDKSKQGVDIEKYEAAVAEINKWQTEAAGASVERYELQSLRQDFDTLQKQFAQAQATISRYAAVRQWEAEEKQLQAAAEHIETEEEKNRQAYDEWFAALSEDEKLQELASRHVDEEDRKNIEAYWEMKGEDARIAKMDGEETKRFKGRKGGR